MTSHSNRHYWPASEPIESDGGSDESDGSEDDGSDGESVAYEAIVQWFDCPFCDGDSSDVSIDIDCEHVVLSCSFCQSGVRVYHGEFREL